VDYSYLTVGVAAADRRHLCIAWTRWSATRRSWIAHAHK